MQYQSGTARCQNTCPRSWNRYSGGRCGSSLGTARTRTIWRLQVYSPWLNVACFSARPFTKNWISLTINSTICYQRRKSANAPRDIQDVSLKSQAARGDSKTVSCHGQWAYLTDLWSSHAWAVTLCVWRWLWMVLMHDCLVTSYYLRVWCLYPFQPSGCY